MNKLATAALCGILCAQASFAQDEDPGAVIEAEKAALKQNAANQIVQEDLAEPDGVSLAMADDGTYQIFARGTGTYDFDDEDDRQDALQEATMKAKANLSKFLSETISSAEGLDSLSKKAKTLTKNGDVTTASVSKEQIKTQATAIQNSSQAILTGAITLESRRIPGAGDSGTYQVTVGISSKTIAAAEEISNGMTDSLNNRRKVVGDGSNVGGSGAGAATATMPGSGLQGAPSSKDAPNPRNTREVRKANTVF